MAPTRFLSIGLVALLTVACDAKPVSPDGSGPGQTASAPKTPAATRTPEELRKEVQDRAREGDAACRKLIESFRARVYDPVRDDGLRAAEGIVRVRVIEASGEIREGAFSIAFLADNPPAQQTVTVPAEGADTLPTYTRDLVQRFAACGFRGGYFAVVTHLPKAFFTLFKPQEGAWGVHCPVDSSGISTSYVFDAENVIVTRGTVSDKARQIESLEWENPQGRYLLKAIRVSGFPTETTWKYDDSTHGVGLPSLVVVKRRESSIELRFAYEGVRIDHSAQILPTTPR